MAHANNSLTTGKFQGTLGKELVFREWEGKTVVAKAPKSRSGDPTAKQAVIQEKFLLASRYAKAILSNADQSYAEAYANAVRRRQTVYCRAVEDFLSSPVVKMIDTRHYKGVVGDKIITRALDDFRVTGVHVEIYAPDGSLIESGDAKQNIYGIDWTYFATKVNNLLVGSTIKAIAFDIPGNEGMLEVIV